MFEVGRKPGIRAVDLAEELEIDAGYLSRLLKGFGGKGLMKRSTSKEDRRVRCSSLTAGGERVFEQLEERSRSDVGKMLEPLNAYQQGQLTGSLHRVRALLEPSLARCDSEVVLRCHRAGDIGWVVARHGELYTREYQWDCTFEGLVAEIAGGFLRHFDERCERCWIAERQGERLGCVFLVKESESVAKLRLLMVEPAARGLGIGRRLVEECIGFARQSGYSKVTLWTNDIRHTARRLYESSGFQLVREEKHRSFGRELVGQYWEVGL